MLRRVTGSFILTVPITISSFFSLERLLHAIDKKCPNTVLLSYFQFFFHFFALVLSSLGSLVVFTCFITTVSVCLLESSQFAPAVMVSASAQTTNRNKQYKFTIPLSLFSTNFPSDMSPHSHKQPLNSTVSGMSVHICDISRCMYDSKRRSSQLDRDSCRCRFSRFLCRKLGGFQSRLVSAKKSVNKRTINENRNQKWYAEMRRKYNSSNIFLIIVVV